MSVNVVINGARRVNPGTASTTLLVDLTIGASHQQIAFSEADLARLGSDAARISYIVGQALSTVQNATTLTTTPPGLEALCSTTAATGSMAMAGMNVTQRTVTADSAVTTSDYVVWSNTASNTIALTLPTASGNPGQRFEVKNLSAANATTITPAGSEKIDGNATLVLALAGQAAVITSNGTQWVQTPAIAPGVGASAAGLSSVTDAAAAAALTALQTALAARGTVTSPA